MSAHNICFHVEVRKITILFDWKKRWSYGYVIQMYQISYPKYSQTSMDQTSLGP